MYSRETNGLKTHIKDDFYQGLVCSECALQQNFFENKKINALEELNKIPFEYDKKTRC